MSNLSARFKFCHAEYLSECRNLAKHFLRADSEVRETYRSIDTPRSSVALSVTKVRLICSGVALSVTNEVNDLAWHINVINVGKWFDRLEMQVVFILCHAECSEERGMYRSIAAQTKLKRCRLRNPLLFQIHLK